MRVAKGDKARIVNGIFGTNWGKIVQVGELVGEHSKYGPVWRVRSLGRDLVTEYGAVGPTCDCPDEWLRPLDCPDEWLRPLPKTTPPQKMVDDEELLAA